MKATLFAVILLLFSVSVSAEPGVKNSPPSAPKPPVQTLSKINLNTADVSTLTQSFKGIGKKRAEAIVRYREKHGAYQSIAGLAEVRGLGKAFVSAHLVALEMVFTV